MDRLVHLKKILLLFLLVSPFLLSTSLAGRPCKFANELAEEADAALFEDGGDGETMATVHERLLRSNTKDYGRYDPSPALDKPPFKLIPN